MGDQVSLKRVIFGSATGTMIEWYDFFIFGSLTTVLSLKFYPPGNDTFALIAYLATFAVGFLVRPFGALFFGRIGDLWVAVSLSSSLSLSWAWQPRSIGLLPTYQTAGWFSPIILILIRVLQGLALGGEYGGAAVFVAEHVPDNRRGFYTSFIQITATARPVRLSRCHRRNPAEHVSGHLSELGLAPALPFFHLPVPDLALHPHQDERVADLHAASRARACTPPSR